MKTIEQLESVLKGWQNNHCDLPSYLDLREFAAAMRAHETKIVKTTLAYCAKAADAPALENVDPSIILRVNKAIR